MTQTAAALPRSFVRVLGIRRTRSASEFVEFSFAIGDPELSVELVLPLPAFLELCKNHDVETITAEPDVAKAYDALLRKEHR